ncbi:MAG: DUF3473 domain-containing protein [Candidatus Hydrogenedentes bacterium]|nr:DUF3473 domain-containing protein [Candidatus Hydrogenedentota bacterium]
MNISTSKPINALTVDVEDYFHAEAFARIVDRHQWPDMEPRVEHNTHRLLDLFDRADVKATFFVLGWVAERYPKLVRRIHEAGHEIASHGFAHRMITGSEHDTFREDVRRAKSVIEDITGSVVIGYRAPTFSVVSETMWALDILADEGYLYDSSIFPIHHDRYGIPDAERFPHTLRTESGLSITEFPLSTARLFGQNMPIAGGGYLRLFPLALVLYGIRQINRTGHPAIVYLHPWEIDAQQPRLGLKGVSKFRHYVNLGRMADKLSRLINTFPFGPVRVVLGIDAADT